MFKYDESLNVSSYLGIRLRNENHAIRIGKNCFKEYFEEVI